MCLRIQATSALNRPPKVPVSTLYGMTTARQHTKTGCKHRLWCHPCGADSDVIGATHDQPAALANADLDRQFHRLKLITISELWLRRDGTPSIKAVKVRARSSSYGALTQVRLLRHPPYSGTPIHRTSCSRRPPRLQGCPALPSPKSTASEFRWLYPQLDPPLLRPCRSRRTTSSTCSATHNCRWCRSMSSKSLLALWNRMECPDTNAGSFALKFSKEEFLLRACRERG